MPRDEYAAYQFVKSSDGYFSEVVMSAVSNAMRGTWSLSI